MISGFSSGDALAGGADTIVALGTAPGRGAIAIIRMSGPNAVHIASRHLDPWPVGLREMRLCTVRNGQRTLDRALVTLYLQPESFTGEDVVEIFTHGGHVVPLSVLATLIESGARQALPGEFTRRAVLNGKLDIVQAEAIGDLVDAQSGAMQSAALYQLDGGLSGRIASVRQDVIGLESLIAYDVDFPEEDDGPISRARITAAIDELLGSLDLLLSTIPVGQIVREGAIVVIAGEPNVGKSSLFNALLGENRAIVTEISGTTRDAIEVVIDAGQWPLRLVDTAGLRESDDIVEKLGIETSERHIGSAHLVLACGDTAASVERTVAAVSTLTKTPVIKVLTKNDLKKHSHLEKSVRVSAATGEGLGVLRGVIDEILSQTYGDVPRDTPVLTRARHIQTIRLAKAEIDSFRIAWKTASLPATVAAVHLRAAAVALEDVIGAVSADDVLERVFSSFCVGK